MATLAPAFTYQIDDNGAEFFNTPSPGGAIAWLNSFQVPTGAEQLTSIDITLYGAVVHPVTVYLWTDPSNDGNPIDATVARSASAFTGGSGFTNIVISPLILSAGNWFFVGGIYSLPADASVSAIPAAIDETDPDFANRSYFANWDNSALVNPNSLSVGTTFFGPEPEGNYLIRVNAAPVTPAGDYNRNGLVDAPDYVLWRKTLGQSVPNGSGADGTGPSGSPDGAVTSLDFGY
jgi:hypothetical protein